MVHGMDRSKGLQTFCNHFGIMLVTLKRCQQHGFFSDRVCSTTTHHGKWKAGRVWSGIGALSWVKTRFAAQLRRKVKNGFLLSSITFFLCSIEPAQNQENVLTILQVSQEIRCAKMHCHHGDNLREPGNERNNFGLSMTTNFNTVPYVNEAMTFRPWDL